MFERSRGTHETAEGRHLRIRDCAYHGCYVELCSKIQERRALPAPFRLVHGLQSLASKPVSLLDISLDSYKRLRTFMRAFESSPVHCLKFLPSGKRLSPAKEGASAMLYINESVIVIHNAEAKTAPPVNIIKYLLGFPLRMFGEDVLDGPFDEMVLEGTFDKLM